MGLRLTGSIPCGILSPTVSTHVGRVLSRDSCVPHSKLTEREQLILQAVVHIYVTTAEPVGSRVIVKRFDLDISAATVRNVMADLEEMGFLQQLHASSGRIPTDSGYRYYVDCLMSIPKLPQSERRQVDRLPTEQVNATNAGLRQTD